MQPHIRVGSLEVGEPATLLSDLIMAGLSFWFAARLASGDADSTRRWWRRAFALIGAGAFAGGLWHGFHAMMSPLVDSALWRLCLLLSVASSLCLWQAAVFRCPLKADSNPLSHLGWIKACSAAVLAGLWPDFLAVLADFSLTMLLLGWKVFQTRSERPQGTRLLWAGIATFVVGGLVQQARLTPHPYFNHNDLFHVIQLLGNTLFFLGARR